MSIQVQTRATVTVEDAGQTPDQAYDHAVDILVSAYPLDTSRPSCLQEGHDGLMYLFTFDITEAVPA